MCLGQARFAHIIIIPQTNSYFKPPRKRDKTRIAGVKKGRVFSPHPSSAVHGPSIIPTFFLCSLCTVHRAHSRYMHIVTKLSLFHFFPREEGVWTLWQFSVRERKRRKEGKQARKNGWMDGCFDQSSLIDRGRGNDRRTDVFLIACYKRNEEEKRGEQQTARPALASQR